MTHARSSEENSFRRSSRMYTRISNETREKDRLRAVTISTTPVWSVGVMTVRGGDWPGSRPSVAFVAFEAMGRRGPRERRGRGDEREDIQKDQRMRMHLGGGAI
jgi:hypothetical protein